MSNSLTRNAGLRVGPLLLDTLIRHYFEHISKGKDRKTGATGNLRQDELLYDEAFTIVKSFLEASSRHTVEELQQFSNARTPSPPWIRVVRLLVPMSCCDEAAVHLIKALGGEDVAKRVVGGTKWWQVRGVKGVDAQWIAVKKDYQQAKRRRKAQDGHQELSGAPRKTSAMDGLVEEADTEQAETEPIYRAEMDDMRCILYSHGGGYYFGSVDQERYCLQRFARKINGRVLAVNYRLAPGYPFPCAIQDVLAAYIYLIRPPEGSSHLAVKPAHIVVAGDSAGGGLTLALLQVIRDSNLPMPAGAVLISPWCDLTHSFPSIHTNTNTDVIPPYGLSLHKPSVLWPPPPEEMTTRVRAGIRSRLWKIAGSLPGVNVTVHSPFSSVSGEKLEGIAKRRSSLNFTHSSSSTKSGKLHTTPVAPVDRVPSSPTSVSGLGTVAPLPEADAAKNQMISFTTASGEEVVIKQQIQLYAPNNLLSHPLVSPCLSYLGGLPPLFIIASDKEVLRDEIIYTAHKAAHPDQYPVKDEARRIYPALEDIESCYGPTQVHLQVYDGAAHVLPVLFSFTTPAKFCFRAIATFCKYATGMIPPDPYFKGPTNNLDEGPPVQLPSTSLDSPRAEANGFSDTPSSPRRRSNFDNFDRTPTATTVLRPTNGRRRSSRISRVTSLLFRSPPSTPTIPDSPVNQSPFSVTLFGSEEDQEAGPAYKEPSVPTVGIGIAGDPSVYSAPFGISPFTDSMIRERVSTRGELRALEPESELAACQIKSGLIGIVSERAARRYLDGRALWDKKFESSTKTIAKHRARNLDRANKDTVRNITQLQMHFFQDAYDHEGFAGKLGNSEKGVDAGLRTSAASWSWAWAIDGDERPPPSSIVSRRDTDEARRLSRIADQPTSADADHISGNKLWSLLINSLSLERSNQTGEDGRKQEAKEHDGLPMKLVRLISTKHVRPPPLDLADDVHNSDREMSRSEQSHSGSS